jgi:hypothetical protein
MTRSTGWRGGLRSRVKRWEDERVSEKEACPDPWHTGGDDEPHDTYEVPGTSPDITMWGFACRTCGFRTVTVESYVPTDKACPRCARTFAGMPDVPTEVCDECFTADLPDMIRRAGA